MCSICAYNYDCAYDKLIAVVSNTLITSSKELQHKQATWTKLNTSIKYALLTAFVSWHVSTWLLYLLNVIVRYEHSS